METQVKIQSLTQKGVQICVSRDCCLILEAIRRLKDGTWQLMDEDADWVDFLLPKISEAIKDHIEYEKNCVLPGLSQDLVHEHSMEHEKILSIMWALEHAKLEKNSERFHGLLDLLVFALDHHHKTYDCYLPNIDRCSDECTKDRVIRRSEGSSLEC